ncbi:URH1 [Candida pseudojiufengensis]|uniref:URH1 n=1 Tax=Candida pseudojiufengensis TaxID=497109 RepID=UPI002224867C|nr:URH1 [Candida pseudojiufengensis]KAI5966421.1 URH1 [Candida pseudojiufengensis]
MTKSQIKIWLDADVGNDDAFAILLAIFNPRFKLLGISTVHGNAPTEMTTHNTLVVLDLLNVHDIKVYRGEENPLFVEPTYALNVHGKFGIGGIHIPETTKNQVEEGENYLQAMYKAICENEGEICIVSTGTLTNIAKLIEKYPDVVDKIKYLSIMGGSFGFGNITPFAEFNFHTDPHAIQFVLKKFKQSKIILSPLNLTHKVIATEQIRNDFYNELNPKKNSKLRESFFDILMFYSLTYKKENDMSLGPPLHDPIAVYSLLPFMDNNFKEYGYIFTKKKLNVEINDNERLGECIYINEDDEDYNQEGVNIGENLDTHKFWRSLLNCLHSADINVNKGSNFPEL